MAKHVRSQIAELAQQIPGALDESEDHEQAILEEWVSLSQRCLALTQTIRWETQSMPRNSISGLIHRITRDRAHLWWGTPISEEAHKYDRVVEVRWQNRRYGSLGLTSGYLASILIPNLPSLFASLCGQTIALFEHQCLIAHQTRHLPHLTVYEELTAREHDILCGLALDESENETACRLNISPMTVRTHRHRLYQRFGVHDSQQAVLRGFTMGYLNVFDLPTQA